MEKIFSTYDFQNLLIIWCMTHMGALLVILILVCNHFAEDGIMIADLNCNFSVICCWCYMSLPQLVNGRSAACDCAISYVFTLSFFYLFILHGRKDQDILTKRQNWQMFIRSCFWYSSLLLLSKK